jgi:hypothetical protein
LITSTSNSYIVVNEKINYQIQSVFDFCANNKEKVEKLLQIARNFTDYLKANDQSNILLLNAEIYLNHLKTVADTFKLLEKDIEQVIKYTLEAKTLLQANQRDDENCLAAEKCLAAKGLLLGDLPRRQELIIAAYTSACNCLKAMHQSLDER